MPRKYDKRNINRASQRIILQKDKDITCKKFGCGKHLSILESMYSDYCFKHQLEIKQTPITND